MQVRERPGYGQAELGARSETGVAGYCPMDDKSAGLRQTVERQKPSGELDRPGGVRTGRGQPRG
jgi:hypothetical protein